MTRSNHGKSTNTDAQNMRVSGCMWMFKAGRTDHHRQNQDSCIHSEMASKIRCMWSNACVLVLPHLQTKKVKSSHLLTEYHITYTTIIISVISTAHRVKYIFYLESIRPIRTAENFEAVEWATGFSNKHGCIVGL